jgi:hypothetical protein
MAFELYTDVILTRDGLRAGDVGTVVLCVPGRYVVRRMYSWRSLIPFAKR